METNKKKKRGAGGKTKRGGGGGRDNIVRLVRLPREGVIVPVKFCATKYLNKEKDD